MAQKIYELENICEKESPKLIQIQKINDQTFVKITYAGEQFIKFSPFYAAILERYSPLWFLLLGAVSAIAAINIPKIINAISSLLFWIF